MRIAPIRRPRTRRLVGATAAYLALLSSAAAHADDAKFNPYFLNKNGGNAPVELTYFSQGNVASPGIHNVDVYVNQDLAKSEDIEFRADAGGEVKPVIRLGMLKALGVNVARLQKEGAIGADAGDEQEMDIAMLMPGASVEFDASELALRISVPQTYAPQQSRGYVDPSLWDRGITAFYVDYQASFNRTRNGDRSSDYRYLGLHNGFNIGGWRFRNESVLTGGTGRSNQFNSNRTYVERDIAPWRGRLALGELYTPGEIFDSVRFRGVQLASDTGMLPDSESGYAPVVRGIAETNATVEVHQNGHLIYSTPVAPGAFEFNDIYPSGSNGDLTVRILESDGRIREYKQSYAYLPVMIRRGGLRYSVTAGEYHNQGQPSPAFAQGTLIYGLRDRLTGYGGVLASSDYQAANVGVGIDSAWGGLSFDLTQSRSEAADGTTHSGQSARVLYSKTLNQGATTFSMAGYRYSTEGFRTFNQHIEDNGGTALRDGHQKSRFDLNINQTFQDRGSLFLSLGETGYWDHSERTRNWQIGYSGSLGRASYSLAMARTDGGRNGADTQFTASLNMPLGSSPRRTQRLSSSITSSRHGDSRVQANVSGYLNDSNTVSYSTQASYSHDYGSAIGAGLSWDAPVGRLSAGYNRGRDDSRTDLGMTGSLVVHGGGVTFGQSVGETFALVEVPKARGVGVTGWNGVRTDRKGFSILPNLQPYRYNWANLDTRTLGSDIEVSENTARLVPTRGAIVKASYAAETGRRVQFEMRTDEGGSLPLGAQAYDGDGHLIGLIDNLSRLLVFGVQDSGRIEVRWSDSNCTAHYDLAPAEKGLAYERAQLVCQRMSSH